MVTSSRPWRYLPTPDRVQYKNPPLVLTVFQIKFNSIWSIGNPSEIGRFQQYILGDYPFSNKVDGVQVDVQVGPAGGNVNQSDLPRGWQFYDVDDEWKLTLQVDSLTIETRQYGRFEELLQRINRAVTALMLVFKPSVLNRIGLRYVNEIREVSMQGMPLVDAVNPILLGPLADPSFQSLYSQSTTDFIDVDEHGRGLNMRFGLVNGGTTVQPTAGTAIPEDQFFLIDMDFYKQFDVRKGTKLDAAQVDSTVEEFHSLVWQVWNWSTTISYRSNLEVV